MMDEGWFGGGNIPSPALVPATAASGLPVEMEEDTYAVQQNPQWRWDTTSMSGRRSSFPGAGPSRNDASEPLRRGWMWEQAHTPG